MYVAEHGRLRRQPQLGVNEVRQAVRVDGVDAGPAAVLAVRGVQLVGDGEGLHEAVGLWLTAAPARGRQND